MKKKIRSYPFDPCNPCSILFPLQKAQKLLRSKRRIVLLFAISAVLRWSKFYSGSASRTKFLFFVQGFSPPRHKDTKNHEERTFCVLLCLGVLVVSLFGSGYARLEQAYCNCRHFAPRTSKRASSSATTSSGRVGPVSMRARFDAMCRGLRVPTMATST